MKLPALLYGFGRDVRRDAKKVVTRLKRGRTIDEAINELGGLIEVENHSALIILEYSNVGRENFHLNAVLQRLGEHHWNLLMDSLDEPLFDSLIETEWGVAMLMCTAADVFFLNHADTLRRDRYRRFLDAAVRHWPVFEAASPRWSRSGSNHAGRPLDESINLNHVLQACNIPYDTIIANAHLGLPELLRRYPPEPEKYVPPQHDVLVLRNEEERLDFTRSAYATYYREAVEVFDMTPKQLASTRAGYDAALRAEGLDPALIDPYWHHRPEHKS